MKKILHALAVAVTLGPLLVGYAVLLMLASSMLLGCPPHDDARPRSPAEAR